MDIKKALEQYALKHDGTYPQDIITLLSAGFLTEGLPQNPYNGKTMCNVSFGKDTDAGNFTYMPVYKENRIYGYYVLLYSTPDKPGLDVNDPASLNLSNITLFCQDWGGLIGLRVVANEPDRFARIIASNTGLPAVTDSQAEMLVKGFNDLIEAQGNMPLEEVIDINSTEVSQLPFIRWVAYSRTSPEFPVSSRSLTGMVNVNGSFALG